MYPIRGRPVGGQYRPQVVEDQLWEDVRTDARVRHEPCCANGCNNMNGPQKCCCGCCVCILLSIVVTLIARIISDATHEESPPGNPDDWEKIRRRTSAVKANLLTMLGIPEALWYLWELAGEATACCTGACCPKEECYKN